MHLIKQSIETELRIDLQRAAATGESKRETAWLSAAPWLDTPVKLLIRVPLADGASRMNRKTEAVSPARENEKI